ncbi:hypothetical protein CC684_07400 [Salmonella enterica subsp. enterica serovar Bareilly]|uniref:DUF551 domain-containing protein n=1 Tax=Salmonella enterica subsp. enterica serovar Bareilly TaxID=58096 RepID=A0A5T4CUC3_SALET|nr:hypothetical protein [Salmonella enterica]EAC0292488.1 hypothetical protein [Salmonella enterica subsp. enterica serovar Oslo]EBC8951248.1 hypothetical protein [Salmonella enterica subsp. enterica serovar Bareilly]EBW7940620.1 hypothetical protein [Salmonella enterica subsp. enterica serovar Richmond]EBX4083010.1 hypothetical protein [Salmonella enterica subsp. enterica serovar Infantis]EDU3462338.1 RNA methyltransferase [Salmonella enterica subsp. enterica serovar Braenderup]
MTITKERLLKIQHWRETYGADSNVMLPAEEAEELARIALAALEAEKGADPVVFTDERNLRHIARGRETSLIWGKQNQEVGDIPLYRHAQPVPVVPDECPAKIRELMASHSDALFNDGDAQEIWNACRTAMLQGVEQPQNARQNIPENIPDGNSPAIPDDWVMVPKEPTQAMIKAWLSEVANFRGHAAGYKAALAAAPQREVK